MSSRGNQASTWWIASAAISVVLSGCTASIPDPTKLPAPPASPAPPYRLEIGAQAADLRVFLDRLYSGPELSSIIADLEHRYVDSDGGYFVRINCTTGGTANVDNRIANGKFAVGAIGAARTGLSDSARELEVRPGAHCP